MRARRSLETAGSTPTYNPDPKSPPNSGTVGVLHDAASITRQGGNAMTDERLPDRPGDGTHIHSLDRCDHYTAGDEVGWLCGQFPMFTNIATARAETGRPGKNDLVTVAPDAEGEYWVVSLRSLEGGRLPVAYKRQRRDAEAFRTSVADFIASWFSDEMSEPGSDDLAEHAEQTDIDERDEVRDLAGTIEVDR